MGTKQKKDLVSRPSPWVKGMSAEEFEESWAKSSFHKEWFNLKQSERSQVGQIKSLYKEIATAKDIDVGLIFGLMSLAANLFS